MTDEDRKLLRIILRNQRLLMMAVASVVWETTSDGRDLHRDNLLDAVRKMEIAFDWIASPGERHRPFSDQ